MEGLGDCVSRHRQVGSSDRFALFLKEKLDLRLFYLLAILDSSFPSFLAGVDKRCAVIWIDSLFLPRASESSEGSSQIYLSPKPLGNQTTLSTMPKAVLFRKNSEKHTHTCRNSHTTMLDSPDPIYLHSRLLSSSRAPIHRWSIHTTQS